MSLIAPGVTAMTGSKKFVPGNGIVDVNGNCEIDFPPTPTATIWTGSITITNSPINVIWTVKINSIPMDVVSGNQTATGLQVGYGDIITVSANGLGVAEGTVINATFTVIESDPATTQLIVPGQDSYLPQPPNGVLVGSSTDVAGDPIFLNLPAGTTYLLFYIQANTHPPSAITTTFQASSPNLAFGISIFETASAPGGDISKVYQLPVPPATQQTVVWELTVGGSAPTGSVQCFAFSSPQLVQNFIDQLLNVNIVSTPTSPVFVSETDAEPQTTVSTAVHLSVASAAGGTLLAAPAAGFCYEILACRVWTGGATTAASAFANWMTFNPGVSSVLLQGTLSGPGSVVENKPNNVYIAQAVLYSANPFSVGSIQFELTYRTLVLA